MRYRKWMAALLMGAAAMAMTACGGSGEENAQGAQETEGAAQPSDTGAEDAGTSQTEAGYLKDIDVEDYVTLGEYKGLSISLKEPAVEEQEIEDYIAYVLQNRPAYEEITDRAALAGDTVEIDYVGKLDDVAFEGGTGSTSDLVLGSGSFIPGFEDGVIGMEIGETKDVEAVFPDPYQSNPDLAGKTAVFTVTLNGIRLQKEQTELTDEYVADFGIEGVTDVESYRTYLHDAMLEQKQSDYELERSNQVVEKAFAAAQFSGTPEEMVNRLNDVITNSVSSYAAMLGMEVADVVAANYGGTPEEYEDTLRKQAEATAQQYIMLQAIAQREGISVSQQEVEEGLAQEAADYGYGDVEEYKALVDVEAYKEHLMTQKVIRFLSENAVVSQAE